MKRKQCGKERRMGKLFKSMAFSHSQLYPFLVWWQLLNTVYYPASLLGWEIVTGPWERLTFSLVQHPKCCITLTFFAKRLCWVLKAGLNSASERLLSRLLLPPLASSRSHPREGSYYQPGELDILFKIWQYWPSFNSQCYCSSFGLLFIPLSIQCTA